MIKNQRQFQITKSQLDTFRKVLRDVDASLLPEGDEAELFRKLEKEALESQIETLKNEVAEYEDLVSGRHEIIEVNSIEDLPVALIKARIASGLSQKDLAERLGLKEQQIQRYEASEYETASLSRITEIVRALKINIRKEILLPTTEISLPMIWKRLETVGIPREFALRRLLPRSLAAQASSAEHDRDAHPGNLVLAIAGVLGRVFGFNPSVLFTNQPIHIGAFASQVARFKLPKRAKEDFVGAYTIYAHYLALLVLSATDNEQKIPKPDHWEDVRKQILANYREISFSNVLQYAWDLGIAVLPLKDTGIFHGACWRIDGRNIVVLKQRTQSQSRWMIDLLHEMFHALTDIESKEFSIIEESEMSESRRNSSEEKEATEFAGDVLLDGRAEELAELCAHLSQGSIESLKTVVKEVAKQAAVSVGALANYLAFRLSAEGKDWWGAAQNLQEKGEDPWRIARNELSKRLKVDRLTAVDSELLSRALLESEEAYEA